MIYLLHLNFLLCIIDIACSLLRWWSHIFLPAGRQQVAVTREEGNNGLGNNEKDSSSSVSCLSCGGSSSVTLPSQCYLFSIYDHKVVTLRLDGTVVAATEPSIICRSPRLSLVRGKRETPAEALPVLNTTGWIARRRAWLALLALGQVEHRLRS